MTKSAKSCLILIIGLSVVSCDSNNNNGDLNLPNVLGSMTASIGGVAWSAVTAIATSVTNIPFPTIIVAGADATGAGMALGFSDVSQTGTFTFDSSNISVMTWTPNASSGTYKDENGTVTITSFTADNITGTFSFEGQRFSDGATINITNGFFDVGNGISQF